MYFGDEIDIEGFLSLATGAVSAPVGVKAEAAELSLVEGGGEGAVEGATEAVTEVDTGVWSSIKGRILP